MFAARHVSERDDGDGPVAASGLAQHRNSVVHCLPRAAAHVHLDANCRELLERFLRQVPEIAGLQLVLALGTICF